ncbi:hypothetical protein [Chitinimonas sp.]|uniref:hypothetical protein n=1 Tax=Chitinimonas sp. TaxID=1934313 RepID=UPI002F92BD98
MRGISCCLISMVASVLGWAGPDERVRVSPGLSSAPLKLSLGEPHDADERTPAAVVSPIFRTVVEPMASVRPSTSYRSDPDETASEQMVRTMEQQAMAASGNTGACFHSSGNESSGGGISWSLNEGFGFYVQGKGVSRQLSRYLRRNEVCPPGDPSPMCKTLPRSGCD